ncbi:hypothetical protein SAMN05660668_02748 [Pseudobutyrivibrio sp. AR14]|uniref:hypothetical protein n=1 Tax=Pseudobutyrivibrio sp. AR14 TaxID=1520804 RepID=UPI0008840735|nr:hypothetical protein [Pseudobutyrivibrio sp. AR14]SCX89107.1 hypothetical protein SAMN05660668_00667 [Pseudobutyrivibrio sp. AR14]SCY45385.1 hypothetical protein SAMN05660668_02689 [Pseudobutyrivibrio sp. AR14]SCY46691.1 hypothetical protein SAMN05660668_02748 [Pseudobutyrivibrio sp. AR14]
MNKSAQLKKELRYQQWFAEVQEYNSRPEGMSVKDWCSLKGIKPPTFYDHLRKVQEVYVDELQQSKKLQTIELPQPQLPVQSFVELPEPVTVPKPIAHGVASIICGNARIEISEDISEAFLLKLIGAISHAQ